jgi:hypothetical protein
VEEGAEFVETFRLLTPSTGTRPTAPGTSPRASTPRGGFTRDLIYLRGLVS